MQILVDIEGVLKGQKEEPIGTGILMVGTLSVYNSLIFMGQGTESQIKYWLDNNKVVDYDRIIDGTVSLVNEDLKKRQIKLARSKGPVDLFITNDPELWAFAFDMGIPSAMFAVPSYTRVEFRPDAPKKVRAWNEIEEAIKQQNILRTQDARLKKTETLNFE